MGNHISQEKISELLDGQLAFAESARIESHIRTCDHCALIRKELAAVNHLFKVSEMAAPPPRLWARISAELEAGAKPVTSTAARPSWWERFSGAPIWPERLRIGAMVPAGALLAILTVLISGSILVTEYRSKNQLRLAAIAEIDKVREVLIAGNLGASNPFRTTAGLKPGKNPFSQYESPRNENPFHSLIGETQEVQP